MPRRGGREGGREVAGSKSRGRAGRRVRRGHRYVGKGGSYASRLLLLLAHLHVQQSYK